MVQPIQSFSDPAFLEFLADSLLEAMAHDRGGVLVHVVASPGGFDLATLPLDGQHPADALFGVVAPADWSVLGTATSGRAWSLDRGPRAKPRRAEVIVLVARDGRVAGRVRHDGQVLTEPPGTGLVLDCLQRALGLPTAPADVPAAHLVAVISLERALQADRLDDGDDLLTAFGGQFAALDWGRLRQLVVRGGWSDLGLTPEDADWLDDGSFCRWVLARWRPLPTLIAEVRRKLAPADARRYVHLLRQLGIDAAA